MKKICIIPLSALLFFAVTGCNNFLDHMPDNRTEIDNVEKVAKLLVTAYPETTYIGFIETRCDGMKDYGSSLYDVGDAINYTNSGFNYTETNLNSQLSDSYDSYWTSCYKAVAVANHALAALKKLEHPAGSEGLRAEAYMARAYAHFSLLTLYTNLFERGKESQNPGIPYVTEPEEVINKDYDRETVAKTLEKIRTDFERGLRNIPTKGGYEQPKFHFTNESAAAFAVRYNLYTQNYGGVINYANQLIGIPTTLETVVDADGKPVLNQDGSIQVIVSPNDMVYRQMGERLLDRESFTAISSSATRARAYTNPDADANLLVSEVESSYSLSTMGRAYSRYGYMPSAASTIYISNATGGFWNYGVFGVAGDPVGFTPKVQYDFKYSNVVAGTGKYYQRISLFRLEEVLLSRAEAYLMMGDYNSALFDLNMYIQRRLNDFDYKKHMLTRDKVVAFYKDKVTDPKHYINHSLNAPAFTAPVDSYEGQLQRALAMTVLDFRRSEFVFEGLRYFDILRWNIPVEHQPYNDAKFTIEPGDPRRVVQLPESTIQSGIKSNEWPEMKSKPAFIHIEKPDYEGMSDDE